MQIEHWNFDTEGELTESALRRKIAARGYQVTRYVYPPGTCFPDHAHHMDKIDAVLSGQFRMTINRQSVVLTAGDCLEVPGGIIHSAEVIGDAPVVSLDAVRKQSPHGQ